MTIDLNLLFNRYINGNQRSPARVRVDLDLAPDEVNPVLQVLQAHAIVFSLIRNVETAAVVFDRQADIVLVPDERNIHPVCFGMLQNVVYAFL